MQDRLLMTSSEEQIFVEDVFKIVPYYGTGGSITINNGLNLSGKGGAVWIKRRDNSPEWVYEKPWAYMPSTANGYWHRINSALSNTYGDFAMTTTGFTLGSGGQTSAYMNEGGGSKFISYSFMKSKKFFDIVTYSGNSGIKTVSHSLGVAPGLVIIFRNDAGFYTMACHRSVGSFNLGSNGGGGPSPTVFGDNTNAIFPDATTITLGNNDNVNASGGTYTAYIFAHDPDNSGVIKCGSYTGNGTGQEIDLGWQPQFILIKKNTNLTRSWCVWDSVRGIYATRQAGAGPDYDPRLDLADSGAETVDDNYIELTGNGFRLTSGNTRSNENGWQYVYMAIRGGPMRTPTTGSEVFNPVYYGTYSAQGGLNSWPNANFKSDMIIASQTREDVGSARKITMSRDVGRNNISMREAIQEQNYSNGGWDGGTIFGAQSDAGQYWYDTTFGDWPIAWHWKKAPGFFTTATWSGNQANNRLIKHNMGAAPELILVKMRNDGGYPFFVMHGFGASTYNQQYTDSANAVQSQTYGSGVNLFSKPTATEIALGGSGLINLNGTDYVAYLFASLAGISKVGTYTGNGTSQTIDCGFAAGARFVLIKRSDASGNFMIWDSARGIVSGNDPYTILNTTSVQISTNDSVDADNSGFVVNQVAASNINVNGATYFYYAVA